LVANDKKNSMEANRVPKNSAKISEELFGSVQNQMNI
jgi:hypothetical protein